MAGLGIGRALPLSCEDKDSSAAVAPDPDRFRVQPFENIPVPGTQKQYNWGDMIHNTVRDHRDIHI